MKFHGDERRFHGDFHGIEWDELWRTLQGRALPEFFFLVYKYY